MDAHLFLTDGVLMSGYIFLALILLLFLVWVFPNLAEDHLSKLFAVLLGLVLLGEFTSRSNEPCHRLATNASDCNSDNYHNPWKILQ